jgi:DNA-binding NarL/FixJ family response regulator
VLLDIAHPDDVAVVVRCTDQLRRGEIPAPVDFRVILRKGQVRYLRSTVAAVDHDGSQSPLIVGSIQDLTAQRLAEREIASRFAVTSALAAWESFEQGMEGLLRELAGAIGARAGTAWVPDGDVLAAKVFWSEDVEATLQLEIATRRLHAPRGTGLPGRSWESKAPAIQLTASPDCERREPALAGGVRALIAVPILRADELLAVLELASVEETSLSERLTRSLTAIGYEVGEFLVHRRGELAPPALTAREGEVLQLAAQGYSSRQIAERLQISPATVKTHFEHIYSKFGVRGRAAAVAHALRSGLIA